MILLNALWMFVDQRFYVTQKDLALEEGDLG